MVKRVDLANMIKEYGPLKNIPEGLHAVTISEEQKRQFAEKVAKINWQNKLSPETINLMQ